MATKIAIKRTSIADRVPNTSIIDTGELALNLTDRKLFSSNGSVVFEIGANVSSLSVSSSTDLSVDSNTFSTINYSVLSSFAVASYGSAKFIVQATQGSDRQISEILVVHDGTTASATEYGTISTGNTLFIADVDISSGNVRLLVSGTSATSTSYKAYKTLMKV